MPVTLIPLIQAVPGPAPPTVSVKKYNSNPIVMKARLTMKNTIRVLLPRLTNKPQ